MLASCLVTLKKQGQPQPHVHSKARTLSPQLLVRSLVRRVFKLEINCFFKIMVSVGLLADAIGLSSNAPSKLRQWE